MKKFEFSETIIFDRPYPQVQPQKVSGGAMEIFELELGVDSGQMAVLAADGATSGMSHHITTFARADQKFGAVTIVDDTGRAIELRVFDVMVTLPDWMNMGNPEWNKDGRFRENVLGTFTFPVGTPLVICDPCYVKGIGLGNEIRRPIHTEQYLRICDLPPSGGLVTDEQGNIRGVATRTYYGDGRYPALYSLHADGSLAFVCIDFDPGVNEG